jgi:hypothetical protein
MTMDIWGWIVVYAVGLTVLQLLVYRYLLNNGGSMTRRVGTPFREDDRDASWSNGPGSNPSRKGPTSGPGDDVERDSTSTPALDARSYVDARTPDDAGDRRCPHCGAENEPDEAFSHCWNCARAL